MKKMEKKAKMYKTKHGLILKSKYLMLVFGEESKTDKGEKKKEEKRRRRRRRRREEKEKRNSRKIKGMNYYGFIWIFMVRDDY